MVPLLDPCPDAVENNSMIGQALGKYGIIDEGPEGKYHLDSDPTLEQIDEVIRHIRDRINRYKKRKFVIVFVVTGHGVTNLGKQAVLLNEFNKETGYYNHWAAEEDILNIAKEFSNVYVIGFFCCCRENWIPAKKHGGHGGCTHQEANMHFRYQMDIEARSNREFMEAQDSGHKNVAATLKIR